MLFLFARFMIIRARALARSLPPSLTQKPNQTKPNLYKSHESHILSMPLYFKCSYLKIQLLFRALNLSFIHPSIHPCIYLSILYLFVRNSVFHLVLVFFVFFIRTKIPSRLISREHRSRQYDSNDMILHHFNHHFCFISEQSSNNVLIIVEMTNGFIVIKMSARSRANTQRQSSSITKISFILVQNTFFA